MYKVILLLASCYFGLTNEPPALQAEERPVSDYRITRIRFFPRAGHAGEMKGGKLFGSLTSATNEFEELAEIQQAPAEGRWSEIAISHDRARAYRFVKYQARNDTAGDVAELAFYSDSRKLLGKPFGTTGSREKSNDPKLAFDGDTSTFFRGSGVFQQYVGLDFGIEAQIARPTLSVSQGIYPGPQKVALTCATPGARIIDSLDGAGRPWCDEQGRPSGGARAHGGEPIPIEQSTILQAIDIKPGLADSTTALAAYYIGAIKADAAEHAECHIGNSLTDTVNDWMEPLAAAGGHKIRYYRFTIPGAPTDWLWDHPGSGFGESHYAQAFLARAPLTDLITQPFAGHGRSVDNEAEYSGRFFDLARKHSPQIQMWLYVQWPATTPSRCAPCQKRQTQPPPRRTEDQYPAWQTPDTSLPSIQRPSEGLVSPDYLS
jgi:hypothetical protein